MENENILSHAPNAAPAVAPSPRCDGRKFALGIHAQQRTFVNAQVRNQRPGALSGAGTGDGDHVFFCLNPDGPEHPADEQLGAAEEDIAVLKFVGNNAQQTGEAARYLPAEFELPLPPVAEICKGPEEKRARPVDLPPERIPPPDQLPQPGQDDDPDDVGNNEGQYPCEQCDQNAPC